MSCYDLTEFEWHMIAPLLPNKPRAVPRVDDRAEHSPKAGVSIRDENKIQWRVVGPAYAVADNYLLSENNFIVSAQLTAVELETLGPTGRAKAFLALVGAVGQWGSIINVKRVLVHVTSGYKIRESFKIFETFLPKMIGNNYAV